MTHGSQSIERILVIRLSALGDCVVAIPVFLALRKHFPHAHIAWAIQDNFAPLIRNLPGLDEIVVFPRRRWKQSGFETQWKEGLRLFRHLRMRRFDATVDIQSNTKSAVLAFLTGARLRIGHGMEEAKELSPWLNNRRAEYPPTMQHIVRRNLHLTSFLGIEETEPQFALPIDPPSRQRILAWLHSNNLREKKYDLLFPFCGGKEKEWPGECFTALAESLARDGRTVLLGCGPGEKDKAERLIPSAHRDRVCLTPRTDILELVEMVRLARVCVGGDTGPLQMAGALNVPNVSLFGPTDPARSHPWQNSLVRSILDEPDTIRAAIHEFRE